MYKKLIIFGIFVLLVPALFIPEYRYFWSIGFRFKEVMPDVQFHGIQLFLCLLVVAAFMFFAGLVHPKISLWFGEKTRKRSSIIYGCVVGIAIVGLVEVNLIASGIHKNEDSAMVSFYEDIEIGSSVSEVLDLSNTLNKHLKYSFSLLGDEKDLPVFDQTENLVDFSYPNMFRTRRVHLVVETNLHPSHADALVTAKYLLVNERIERSEI